MIFLSYGIDTSRRIHDRELLLWMTMSDLLCITCLSVGTDMSHKIVKGSIVTVRGGLWVYHFIGMAYFSCFNTHHIYMKHLCYVMLYKGCWLRGWTLMLCESLSLCACGKVGS